ncbi:MAG: hypothetical protein JNK05_10215 [Myxococcales bacterium]|nr:hypothetical protein [Myxococcales bacterium]
MGRPRQVLSLALILCASVASCARSCGERQALREKSSREWRASVRCHGDASGGRMWQVFRVECFAGGFVEVVVPRSEQRGGSQRELQEACNARAVDIASRETDEGTILAASLTGTAESAVIYRARNSAVFAARDPVTGDSERAVAAALPPIRAALRAIDRGELRDAVRSPAIDAIDGPALLAHKAALIANAQRCLVPASLVTRLVKTSPDEIAAQLFEPAYVTGDCTALQRGLEAAPRDVVGPLVERWARDHNAQPAPWPVALVRYAGAHGITLPTHAASAATADAGRP